jgi:hypothetical protein
MWQLAAMRAPSSTTTPGPKNTLGLDDHVAADLHEAEPHHLPRLASPSFISAPGF